MIGKDYRERISETDLEKTIYWSREVVALLDFFCFVEIINSVNTLLNKRSVEYMSEVMISRRGGGGENIDEADRLLIRNVFTTNKEWVVPNRIYNNAVSVRIFGAGGVGYNIGGGSGWMNNDVFTNLEKGSSINIVVANSANAGNGGTTSFGSYLSANGGGSDGTGGAGGYISSGTSATPAPDGYQFGGGYGNNCSGGNGGVWGGGGAGTRTRSGDGGIYGGGAGGYSRYTAGGNGGTYGGGGGGAADSYDWLFSFGGKGGTYGGNGGTYNIKNSTTVYAENGINTSTWTNVFNDGNGYFRGWGRAGSNNVYGGGGGGGFGGNGGSGRNNASSYCGSGGSGGGYGSNGVTGSGGLYNVAGGGGYGGDGGIYGGGGGYGKVSKGDYSGGGYYCPGNQYGGGGFGIWDNNVLIEKYGSGGFYNSKRQIDSGSGVCIIEYYI